jgi:hypothetical protein
MFFYLPKGSKQKITSMDEPHIQTPPQSDAARRKNRLPLLAALIYSLVGLLWILFSDQLLL